MTDKKKMTAYNPSAASDGKQSKSNKPNNIITEKVGGRNTQNANIFREVKSRVNMAEAARLYGVNIRAQRKKRQTSCLTEEGFSISSELSLDQPEWLFDGTKVNEVMFCDEFTERYPMKYIDNSFFTADGIIPA